MGDRSMALRGLIGVLIAARVGALAWALLAMPDDPAGHFVANDLLRYYEIASEPGILYRDLTVEIPPLEAVYLRIIGADTPRSLGVANALLMFTFDVGTAAAVGASWGKRGAAWYLLLGLPLAPFLLFRLDLIPVFLAALSVALVRRKRAASGGVVLGAAVLAKLWPLVLVPISVGFRRWRTLAFAGITLLIGTAIWLLLAGGTSGIRQVVTFRGSAGWQIESLVGSVLLATTEQPVIFEGGANRVGTVSSGVRNLLAAGLVGGGLAVGALARKRPDPNDEAPAALTAVCLLLLLAPILSWQYVSWLLPWAAGAAARRRWWLAGTSALAICLTAVLVFLGVELTERQTGAVATLLARNAALVALGIAAIAFWWETRR